MTADPMVLEVDQNRAVAMAAAERPVVYAQHAGVRRLGERSPPDEAQERGRAGGKAQPVHHASAGLAAEREGEQAQDVHEPRRTSRVRRNNPRQPFGENASGTGVAITEEFAHGEHQADAVLAPGQISERAPVATVNTAGEAAANRTGGFGARGEQCGGDLSGTEGNILELEVFGRRNERGSERSRGRHHLQRTEVQSASPKVRESQHHFARCPARCHRGASNGRTGRRSARAGTRAVTAARHSRCGCGRRGCPGSRAAQVAVGDRARRALAAAVRGHQSPHQ